jgi:DNA-binding CsgD family transcriptional regulator
LIDALPGHPPWRARALAALTHVRLARPERGDALHSARAALEELQATELEELFLDIWRPCAQAILDGGSEAEAASVRERLATRLGAVATNTLDEDICRRWFATTPQSDLIAMVGGMETARETFQASPLYRAYQGIFSAQISLTGGEQELLRLMTEARPDAEIATTLRLSEAQVAGEIDALLARMNAPSRGAATAFALTQRLV